MKRKISMAALIIVVILAPVAAVDFGINLNAGLKQSLVNTYVFQDVAFRLEFNDTFGCDIGIDLMENFIYDPYFYFSPSLLLYAGHFYIKGGILFYPDIDLSSDSMLYYGQAGFTIGNWQMGPGIGTADIGIDFSPTISVVDSEDPAEAVIGSIFTTIFNIFKVKAGFSCYLPF
ncbi:MAG: hypothetical protein K5930_00490 [Treponemataceae bacterium]|nr:hypothetical protein [Treponemataceae bacterium]